MRLADKKSRGIEPRAERGGIETARRTAAEMEANSHGNGGNRKKTSSRRRRANGAITKINKCTDKDRAITPKYSTCDNKRWQQIQRTKMRTSRDVDGIRK